MKEAGAQAERYERAKKRVEEIKGFYIHVGVFVVVNLGLFAINRIATPDTVWFYWPLLGWGVGVAIHAFTLVAEGGLLGREWEERKVQKLLQRDETRLRKGA